MTQKTLIICEKPTSAERIADALSTTKTERKKRYGISYYIITQGNDQITVCSASGHLYGVTQKDNASRREYPVWDYIWKPKYETSRGRHRTKTYIKLISDLSEDSDAIVNACDYDIEGSVIGYTIIKYACKEAKATRMKFSTLTDEELKTAYRNLSKILDFPLIQSGMCRHEIDWLYGVNLSRALTESARNVSGYYTTLSTGRVQGPTLRFIVERELEILKYIPTPFWEAYLILEINGEKVKADYTSKIETALSARKLADACEKASGTVKTVKKTTSSLRPPFPFDITAMQTEAYRHFKYPPRTALNIAEQLYLKALISYPRTSSQKLPPSINYEDILSKLEKANYSKYTSKIKGKPLEPVEGPKKDLAHPAIYPTGQKPTRSLTSWERKMYDLIVKRFISTFADSALRESIKAEIEVKGYLFHIKGTRILKPGWVEIYSPYVQIEEQSIPRITEGTKVNILEVVIQQKYTQPPLRFNPSSLLKRLEKEGIGTKATRADIIQTLYNRGYIESERIKATALAYEIIDILAQYSPEIIDINLTRMLEDQMYKIETGTSSKNEVVYQSIISLRKNLENLKNNEENVGIRLNETIMKMKKKKRSLTVICPKCGSELNILKSRKTGKRFIGCTGKWEKECDFSLPIPQKGKITLLGKRCGKCNFQIIQIKLKGRRPFTSCPYCYVHTKE